MDASLAKAGMDHPARLVSRLGEATIEEDVAVVFQSLLDEALSGTSGRDEAMAARLRIIVDIRNAHVAELDKREQVSKSDTSLQEVTRALRQGAYKRVIVEVYVAIIYGSLQLKTN